MNVEELSLYGKPIRAYKGFGTLYFGDGGELDCAYDLVQVCDGGLYCLTHTEGIDMAAGGLQRQPDRLVGKTEDGRKLALEITSTLRSEFGGSPDSAFTNLLLDGRQVTAGELLSTQNPPLFLVFGLTNLIIADTLTVTLDGIDAVIQPVEGDQNKHRELVKHLKGHKGVEVTYELIVQLENAEQLDDVVDVVNNLCALLTLAQGCRVEWIYYDVTAADHSVADHSVLKTYHRNAITKPYSMLRLIPLQPKNDLETFINQAYPNFVARGRSWELRKAIDAYTDAKLAEDYLELRGLKMAITVEHLRARYLSQNRKVTIIHPKKFDKAVESLVTVVRWILPSVFPKVESDRLDMMANHARGFNWYPFRRSITDLCESLGLEANSNMRKQVMEIRNRLVHYMAYHSEYGTAWEQYAFLMTFVGKLLLAILGYEGYYSDWTKAPDWVGGNSEIRVKLDLRD